MAKSLDENVPYVPGRTVSEWMVATTDAEKQAIIDDIAGSVYLPALLAPLTTKMNSV